jgi:hypothetical protein
MCRAARQISPAGELEYSRARSASICSLFAEQGSPVFSSPKCLRNRTRNSTCSSPARGSFADVESRDPAGAGVERVASGNSSICGLVNCSVSARTIHSAAVIPCPLASLSSWARTVSGRSRVIDRLMTCSAVQTLGRRHNSTQVKMHRQRLIAAVPERHIYREVLRGRWQGHVPDSTS